MKIFDIFKGIGRGVLSQKSIIADNSLSSRSFFTWTGNEFSKGFTIDLNSAQDLVVAYKLCSPVSTIINRLSLAMANGKCWVVDESDSNVIEAYPHISNIIDAPNPFQSWQEFIIQLDAYRNIFGEVFVYAPTKVGLEKQILYVLNPTHVTPIISKEIDFFAKKEDIIKGYKYRANYFRTSTFDVKDILHIKDLYQILSDDAIQFRGKSRLTSLENEIKNVIQAQEAIHALNKDRGAMGVLSNKSRDVAGLIALTPKEREEIEERLRTHYGLSRNRSKVLLTDSDLQWQSMTFNVRDLMLFEGIKQNIESISDAFNYPFELLANSKGTTYANKNEAKKSLYQDGVMPIAEMYAQAFTTFFGLKDGHKFTIDFSHIECMQEARKEQAEAKRALNAANQIAFQNGIISMEEWRESLDLDEKINGNT